MADWLDGPVPDRRRARARARPSRRSHVARELLRTRSIGRIAVVCPTAPLTRQWAAAAARMGVQLAPDAANLRPPPGFDGVAVTYARVAQSGARWAKQCSPGTLVIADEAHHLGDELAWGQGFNAAFAGAARRLLLSGTPFRSDAAPIPGVRYDSDGIAVPDVAYSYADAVRDGVCRPVTFVPYDGVLQWQSRRGDDRGVVRRRRPTRARPRAATGPRSASSSPTACRGSSPRPTRSCSSVREAGHRDAGGLVVAADGEHARAVAKVAARGDRQAAGGRPAHGGARGARSSRRSARGASRGSSR